MYEDKRRDESMLKGVRNMDFSDNKYSQLNENIRAHYKKFNDWERVRNFDFFPGQTIEQGLSILCMMFGLKHEELNIDIWNQAIDYHANREKKHEVVKMGKDTLNNATISSDSYSAWKLYESGLKEQKWSQNSIESVEKSSYQILRNLSMDTTVTGPVKGLVVGNVQSGKTANMAGVMAMAADYGFNYFIILSGVIENLREQTANRLYSDMSKGKNGYLHWHTVNNPSLKSRAPEHNINNFNLATGSKFRYFSVCL
ncbi:MAG: hypothetical protein ACK5MZ_12025 [Aestuariibaculum sp.]